MKRNRKKSKALIITFIIMLILLFVFYLFFIRNSPFGDTRGTSSENRGFASLFSKSKNKDLDTVDDNTNNNQTNGNGSDQNNNDSQGDNGEVVDGTIIGGGNGSGGFDNRDDFNNNDVDDIPNFNPRLSPIPTPDFDSTYIPPTDTVTRTGNPSTDPDIENIKQCSLDDYKLTFTDEEQAELDRLLREFYRIASSVKTQDDIDLEYEAKQSYIDIVDEANDLTAQCYTQTTTPTYVTGIDYGGLKTEEAFTPKGTFISRNFSHPEESRIERKANPWFGNFLGGDTYFYTGTILERSERFMLAAFKNYKTSGQNYYSGSFNNNFEARARCLVEAKSRADKEKLNLPNGYSVSYSCFMLDGRMDSRLRVQPASSSISKVRYPILRGGVWYPKTNSENSNTSSIDPKEWYFAEATCLRRDPSGCEQRFLNHFSAGEQIPPIEWAYKITVRSPYLKDLATCNDSINRYNHKDAICRGSGTESGYIIKVWNQKLVNDGSDKVEGYVPPIDYPIFERLFNVW